MPTAAITVENLSKAYRIGLAERRHETLVGTFTDLVRAPWRNFRRLSRLNTFKHHDESDDMFWALRDVSFEVAEGEVVGIIGRNGAGKSTLLKILSRITEPTSGRAVIRGRVSSLLEVGTGFHQELTGRENVYMNGTILGMTKREIDRKFDEIVDFSGVEKFLDTPIKHYSSGMKVRLAFSVAAHLEPELLIIDEVLAVGDVEFQKRCLGKMEDVAREGRTVLFVSHNMAAVQALCTRGICVSQGTIERDGLVDEVLESYLHRFHSTEAEVDLIQHSGRTTRNGASMRSARLKSNGKTAKCIAACGELEIEVDFELSGEVHPILGVVIKDSMGIALFGINNRLLPAVNSSEKLHNGTISCRFSSVPLVPGRYLINLYFGDARGDFDIVQDAIEFEIVPAHIYQGGQFPSRVAGPFLTEAEFNVVSSRTCVAEL